MSNLRLLSVENLSLVHMPSVICNTLVNLRFLSLANNRLEDLPDQLSTLTSLQSLDLRGNRFQEVPSRSFFILGLQRLVLIENEDLEISRDCVDVLGCLESLCEVYLAKVRRGWSMRSTSNLMFLANSAPAHLRIDVESLQVMTHGEGIDVMPDRTVRFQPTDFRQWDV